MQVKKPAYPCQNLRQRPQQRFAYSDGQYILFGFMAYLYPAVNMLSLCAGQAHCTHIFIIAYRFYTCNCAVCQKTQNLFPTVRGAVAQSQRNIDVYKRQPGEYVH